ncbi:MAG: amino acid permease [Pseudomonadota bacterium]
MSDPRTSPVTSDGAAEVLVATADSLELSSIELEPEVEDSVAPDAEAATPAIERTIGLGRAIGLGVGAIVGGGILALAGAAFAVTGPSAIVAFALNGLVAVLTALSFAEMSTAFPRSGGAYAFAKKVLTVQAAFAVGWILWFAYIVAAVLYALGFAEFGVAIVEELARVAGVAAPTWIESRGAVHALALVATLGYAGGLVRRVAGGSQWATWAKLAVFVLLILAGLVLLPGAPSGTVRNGLTPFFAGGPTGLVQAMGFTFIALQGFEVIAAVAGEVREPRRVLPRGMLYSLGIAIAIYLPLLLLTSTLGVPAGRSIVELSRQHPETVMAVTVRTYLGLPGYWLVLVAAVLSMLSALQANLLAASRISLSMARERTLPRVLAEVHERWGTPIMAIAATTLAVVAIVFMIPDLAAAGAAASLIFLVSFALVHGMTYLRRRRSGVVQGLFRIPLFPLVPVVGGAACTLLALFQAVAVPSAGAIMAIWLGLGVLLYFSLFRSRARVVDALAEAHDPDLARLRGRSPLVLVPVASPERAAALVGLGNAMAAPLVGRVELLSVVRQIGIADPLQNKLLADGERVLHEAMQESLRTGHTPEALLTMAVDPWAEIRRVALAHRCQSLVLGLTRLGAEDSVRQLEDLINDISADASILRSDPGFHLDQVSRVLVPIGGRGGHDDLRARVLGSLCRARARDVVFARVVPPDLGDSAQEDLLRGLRGIAVEEAPGQARVELLAHADPVQAVVDRARDSDLVVLGLARVDGRRHFGHVGLDIARRSPCACLLISRR